MATDTCSICWEAKERRKYRHDCDKTDENDNALEADMQLLNGFFLEPHPKTGGSLYFLCSHAIRSIDGRSGLKAGLVLIGISPTPMKFI